MKRMERQFAFALEADKEKNIIRHTLVSDGSRRENDAEHAWHAALMAVLLSEYANEKIDVLRTVTMLLIHDMVEIDAGDTYAYDEQANLNRREREEKAADRVFGILPGDQRGKLRALWEEFEACETPENATKRRPKALKASGTTRSVTSFCPTWKMGISSMT